jgi:hypothetical protein
MSPSPVGLARAGPLLAAWLAWSCRDPNGVLDLPSKTTVRPIELRELCVSSGALRSAGDSPLGERWLNTQPSLRATIPSSAGHHAAITFRYLGPTERETPLGSGQSRRQLGLKLLSRDTCNLVYVMWRFGPRSSIVASVKSNPGASRHGQCKNHGYRNLRPLWSAPVEEPALHSQHELSARIIGDTLEVQVDARPVLRARAPGSQVPAFGSSGLRSDNVRFELLRVEADMLLDGAEAAARLGCTQ